MTEVALLQFQRARSAEQLKLHWIHFLQPGVNTGPWSKEEKQNLKVISLHFQYLYFKSIPIVFEMKFNAVKMKFTTGVMLKRQILARNGKNSIDWDEIAMKMQTNRTAFDCFSRYQERHNEDHRKFGWTDEENKKFIDSLSSMGNLGIDEIHWSKIRLLFPGRSKSQLYS